MASMKRCSFIMVVSALLLTGIAVVVWHYVMPPLHFVESEEYPDVFPDYVKVTIPESMSSDNGALFTMTMKDGRSCRITRHREGDTLWVKVSAWHQGDMEGISYRPFPIYIHSDSIDPYVVYRLIEPGYESWSRMSISQRSLVSWNESTVVSNASNERGCINCHSFSDGRPERMLFHSRVNNAGTVFVLDGNRKRIDFTKKSSGRQVTYPSWHPSGRYVAFSSNTTRQCFMLKGRQPIEVYDTASDIMVYNVEKDSWVDCPYLNSTSDWETFPSWSPDGSELYFCRADSVAQPSRQRNKVHYRLMRIAFDGQLGTFVGEPQEVPLKGIDMTAHSVSFPRISIDGFLMFTLTDYGTFPIWHDEADLWMLDLKAGDTFPCTILNSDKAESYHCWSSNGRWVVFGSRRLDGRYTRLYFSHFDGKGQFTKPFLLPQKHPRDNILRMKSYNIPEFVKGEVSPVEKF